MSLQHAAKHLEKHGRNGDTMLVHMSPGEVKSLNDLAMAHGGHLTTNPHTGLPEAGFLSSILPMVAGGALAATGIGAPMAALLVGGGTSLMTGSLKKGLMAGLGAYGGAGIGSALAQSGVQAATAASPEIAAAQQAAMPETLANAQSYQASMQPGFVGPQMSPEMYATQQSYAQAPVAAAREAAIASQPSALGGSFTQNIKNMGGGAQSMMQPGGISKFYENLGNVEGTFGPKTTLAAAAAPIAMEALTPKPTTPMQTDKDMGQRYTYNAGTVTPTPVADASGREQTYFRPSYTPVSADAARGIYGYAGGGPVEMMSNANAVGANTGYPMADINKPVYASPFQTPVSKNVVHGTSDTGVNPMTGEMAFADGGISHLGDYSDGGRLLRGPGDGVSDSIPAVIGKKQPARLADGEFVVPARIVSELGNGSTEAGARKLYAMMDRIQKARGATVGKGKVAKNSRSERFLPA